MTFTDPYILRHRQSPNETAVLVLGTNLLFAGPELTSLETRFHSAELVVPHVSAWLANRPFDSDAEHQDGNWVFSAEHVSRTHFDQFIQASNGGFRLRMFSVGTHSQEADKHELANTELIGIKPKSKMDIDYFSSTVWGLMQYLSLMSIYPFQINSLVLREKLSRDPAHQDSDPRYAVVYSPKRSDAVREQQRANIIFNQTELSRIMRATLKRFFSASPGLSTALAIFHSIRLEPPTVDMRLILLVQAYEAAFSDKNAGQLVPKSTFRKMKKVMQAAIPEELSEQHPEFIDGINRALAHANSKTLRDKLLIQLDSMNDKAVDRLFLASPEQSIKRIVDTRNYVTHRSERAKTANVVLGPELFNLVESLHWVLWYLLMRELGFPKSILTNKITTHRAFEENNRSRIQLSPDENRQPLEDASETQ